MEKKSIKPTNAQLQRRIQNAIVFVPKDKETQSVFFADKGLRLTVTQDTAVIATGYHRHVFDSFNAGQGISRPYLYTKRIIEIANENDCKTEDGYSFARLLEVLKAKEDQSQYNICVYYDWWVTVNFSGLYSIAEDEISSWLVYFKYMTVIATNSIILEEHKEDLTNNQFVDKFVNLMKDFTSNVEDRVLFKAMSDEEIMQQEMSAIKEQELEQSMK